MKEIILSPEIFSQMHNLRLLKIYNFDEEEKCKLKFPQGLHCLPDALTYLYWDGYPLKSLPSDFSPENIVILQMPNSQLEELWNGVQDLGKLIEMDLSHSKHLTKIPDLAHGPNLETINLEYCISLLQLPPTLQYHCKLSSLNLRCCSKLEKLPELSRNLKELVLEGCTEIKEVPSSFGSLDKLKSLNLRNCKALMNLPSSTSNMDSLKSLSLSACASIDMFPSLPRFLNRLDISGTVIKAVPSSVDKLSGLVKFYLKGCKRPESLPTSNYNLKAVTFLSLSGCSKLRYIPEISEPLESLRFLHLDETRIKELPSSIGNLKGLKELNLDNCCKLKALPDSINKLNNTEHFSLFGCSKLEKFPTLSS
nr:disease resistance-like protein DSC1 [Ziziphus jujuba var. spinosa]